MESSVSRSESEQIMGWIPTPGAITSANTGQSLVLCKICVKLTLIWDLGRAFHMKPTSSVQCYRWRLIEKRLTRLFYATNSESRPETFQTANGPVLEFRKKNFPRHKTRSWEGINK